MVKTRIASLICALLAATSLAAPSPALAESFVSTPTVALQTDGSLLAGQRSTLFVHEQLPWASRPATMALTSTTAGCSAVYVGTVERGSGIFDLQFWATCPASTTGTVTWNAAGTVTLANASTAPVTATATMSVSTNPVTPLISLSAAGKALPANLCATPSTITVRVADTATQAAMLGVPVTITFTPDGAAAQTFGPVLTDADGKANITVTLRAGTVTASVTPVGAIRSSSPVSARISVGACAYRFQAISPVPSALGYGDRISTLSQLVAIASDGTIVPLPNVPTTLQLFATGVDPASASAKAVSTTPASTTRDDGWANHDLTATSAGTLALVAGGDGIIPRTVTRVGTIKVIANPTTFLSVSVTAIPSTSAGSKTYTLKAALVKPGPAGSVPASGVKVTVTVLNTYPTLANYPVAVLTTGTDGKINAVITPPVSGSIVISFARASGLPTFTLPVGEVTQVANLRASAVITSKSTVKVTSTLTPSRARYLKIEAAPVLGGVAGTFMEFGSMTSGTPTTFTLPSTGVWLIRTSFDGDELGSAATSSPATVTAR